MAKKLFEIQTDKIENGTKLMYNNTALTSWVGDLISLTNGSHMFRGCSELTSFTSDLSSLTDGYCMFYNCDKLTSFDADLSSLTDAYQMFAQSAKLESFTFDLSTLTNGFGMFYYCTNFKSFSSDLSNLTDGRYMFSECTALDSFTADLSSLSDGRYMFKYCNKLTSFSSDSSGSPVNLSNLTDAYQMFFYCTNLTSFSSDLSSLTDAVSMFCYCVKLTSFNADLSSLTDGGYMFYSCNALTTFDSDLSSLTDGGYMFYNCKLNAPSVQNIALTINKITNSPRIDIGVATTITSDAQVKRDLGLIKHKGWNLYVNGSTATSNYTLPKYAGCTTTAQVKAKDSNYKTNDIVNGAWVEYLPDLTDGSNLFIGSDGPNPISQTLKTFTSYFPALTNGSWMLADCTNLTTFSCGDLNYLTNGDSMFYRCTKITTFNSSLKSLTYGKYMFSGCLELTTFNSDLSSLTNGYSMFYGCKLNTNSLKNIADTIKNVTSLTNGADKHAAIWKNIDIGIANSTPNAQEKTAFNTIASKGWTVYVNGSTYSPTSTASIMTLDELGNEVETPIPFYAKPLPSDEETASYVDDDGNYYNILGAQFIYGDDLSTYGMFTCEADAAANMRLTKIEK